MNESVRELKIVSVSKCTRDGGAYMAILRELEGERMMCSWIEVMPSSC